MIDKSLKDAVRARMRERLEKQYGQGSTTPASPKPCVQCGAALQGGAKFCAACGTKVEQTPFCTQCGTKLAVDTKFCGECGTAAGGVAKGPVDDVRPKQGKVTVSGAYLCSVNFAKIREDWDQGRFGNEVSFWSRDDDSLFVDKQGNPLLESQRCCFQMIKYDDGVAYCLRGYSGNVLASGAGYAETDDVEEELKEALKKLVSLPKGHLGDLAFLMLNSDDPDNLECDLETNWICTLGEGSVLFVEDDVAGGVFVEVDPPASVDVTIEADGSFDYDGDEVSDARDESLQFVGVMLK